MVLCAYVCECLKKISCNRSLLSGSLLDINNGFVKVPFVSYLWKNSLQNDFVNKKHFIDQN